MPMVISSQYLDRLCADREYEGLAWISAVLCGSHRFNPSDPTYGLPSLAFCLVERLAWFAQSTRSGASTYFEATPLSRQSAMLSALNDDSTHPEFAEQYNFGICGWHIPSRSAILDGWLDKNDDLNNRIAWQTVATNRELLQGLANVDT
jgi:hypothetical protein